MIHAFLEKPLDNNNYVIIDEASGQAALIDCSAPDEKILTYLKNQGATLKYILLTHGHFDHILGVPFFQEQTQAPVYLHAADHDLMADVNGWTKRMGLEPLKTVPQATFVLDEHSELLLGEQKIQVLSTPGHTPGSVCFLIGRDLFSGDTLFYRSYGRTDLPGGSEHEMRNSLTRLFQLSPDTRVHPGHGSDTTIATEIKHNPFSLS